MEASGGDDSGAGGRNRRRELARAEGVISEALGFWRGFELPCRRWWRWWWWIPQAPALPLASPSSCTSPSDTQPPPNRTAERRRQQRKTTAEAEGEGESGLVCFPVVFVLFGVREKGNNGESRGKRNKGIFLVFILLFYYVFVFIILYLMLN